MRVGKMPGFQYVLVPCDINNEMQELHYEKDVTLEKDTFREFVEKFFAQSGATVDKKMLLEQLKERTGKDLEEALKNKEMDPGVFEKMMSSTSVEIFPVQMPVKDSGFMGVSAYCDDKGVSKELEINIRVSSLVQACGYPGQQFRGDVFLGRVFDDQDAWERKDFTIADCSSDALWVGQTKKQRSNRNVGDMANLGAKMGMANDAARIMPGNGEEQCGETADYKWRQADDEVEITFKMEGLQKSDAKLVKATFGRSKIKVEAKGTVLLDGQLGGTVDPDECTWTLSDGVLQVTLTKGNNEPWNSLLKD